MLTKLDRYIIKKYLSTFLFICLIFTIVSVALDFSEKVDEAIEHQISAKVFIFDYYIPFIPYINGLLWPIFALIAVIFFTSRLASNSEIISIYNSGTSFYRLMLPYFLTASFLTGLLLVGNHIVIPKSNKSRIDFENQYIWKRNIESKVHNIHMFLEDDTKLYIRRYSIDDSLAYDVTLEKLKDNKLQSKLFSSRAEWLTEEKKWRLKNYRIRNLKGLKEELIIGKTIDTTLSVGPQDLEIRDNEKTAMTSKELKQFFSDERQWGLAKPELFEVEYYRRWADPFTLLILTFIGMSIASRKIRGGIGIQLINGVTIGALFVMLSKFSATFCINGGLAPWIGMWIPNIVFSGVVIWLITRAQK
ncbi:MAG: LptF/LptG family permease [Bacteroidota bacterium]